MNLRFSFAVVFPVLLILGFMIYAPVLNAPFIFDDYEFIKNNPLARDFSALCGNWREAGLKFLTYLTFVMNFTVGGHAPFGYHAANIFLHAVNCGLLFLLARRILLTPQIIPQFSDQQKSLVPAVASLVFLVHPVATSAVSYVWQRAELLTTMFYLSAVILYVIARQEKRNLLLVASALCFGIGMFAKGTMISLPLAVILLECALWPASSKKTSTIIFSMIAISLLSYLFLWEPWRARDANNPVLFIKLTGSVPTLEYIWTQFFVTVKYLGLAFFPVSQNFDYEISLAASFLEPRTFISALVLLVLIITACLIRRKHRLTAVGIFWFLLALLPAACLSGREPMWEYRMYLPLAGLVLGMTVLIFQLFDRRKALSLAVIVIFVFSILAFSRNVLWQDPERLLLDNIQKSPKKPNPYQLLGAYYLQEGRIMEAETYLERTIVLAPDAAESYNNLALIKRNRGEADKAREMFETAIRLRPSLTGAYINLAYLLLWEGNTVKAEEILRQSLTVQETEGAYAALGKIYLSRGRLDEAEGFLKQALLVNPRSSQAYFWYGELWQERNDPEKALEMLREAERLNPNLAGLVPRGK